MNRIKTIPRNRLKTNTLEQQMQSRGHLLTGLTLERQPTDRVDYTIVEFTGKIDCLHVIWLYVAVSHNCIAQMTSCQYQPLILNSLRTAVTAYVTEITPPYGPMSQTL